MIKKLILIFSALALFAPIALAQKKRTTKPRVASTPLTVKIVASTTPVTVSGVTKSLDKATIYNVYLKKEQKLLVTPDSKDVAVQVCAGDLDEPYNEFRGEFDFTAWMITTYQIIPASHPPGRKYTLTFKLVK